MKFSERIGETKVKSVLQKSSIDSVLKIKIWNIFYDDFVCFYENNYSSFLVYCFKDLWTEFFNNKSNTFKISSEYNLNKIESWFFSEGKWYEVYNFIEKISEYTGDWSQEYTHDICDFVENCNAVLKSELSAYRIINYRVTPISDELEIESIENALKSNDKFKEVSIHINASISFLSNRENPDYRNSIKESISAVETICKIITSENTLGKALNNLEKSGIKINPSLKSAFEKLYTYTNDSKTGIRHALIEGDYSPDFDEAKFMLVTCSTFINYLKAKAI